MKSMLKFSLLAATVALAVGCQKEEAPKADTAAPAETAAAADANAMQFKSDDDKAAYAIGVSFATYLKSSVEKPKEIGIELKDEMVLKGITDAFGGNAGLNEDEIRQTLEGLDARVSKKMADQAAEKSAAALKAGKDFRTEFAKQDGVMKTDSGILYQVETKGDGATPKATDVVKVNYVGTLTDGTKFDSSIDRGEPATFPLNRVIPGWTEGVQLMKVGSKYKFVIPPELAYGDQESPSIPANSTLVFEVELLSIEAPAEQPVKK
ncbi:peptidylprolyl isomerase [Vibrio sp. UCD-FRSSP16_10]|uniref:FKBP-type peptidyl-prolyl cis-trans isomerase n=1 Tax=unclassified Vibrio TaxID=2614977 RepID=UPI0007FD7563|nr:MULTISPECIES: FKBP-type peptidyl-prolyl cis-trans isomerase [unclassified Vibrio]OBT10047.1 peptidylprolyl isomerase [Vibrio sp. UCD-FRSSP16_30]OBT18837.1 peptidylprolyl isomerase [Vibrio sp. UCD-FRSSP16_10]